MYSLASFARPVRGGNEAEAVAEAEDLAEEVEGFLPAGATEDEALAARAAVSERSSERASD